MKNEKETKQKLLESAKKEFLSKGFLQASLRNICKNAGVTTGALYFFFRDKEDLFSNIVDGPLHMIMDATVSHYEVEKANGVAGEYAIHNDVIDDFSSDQNVAELIIHYLYQYKDEFLLLLLKAQGTKYEHVVDQFVQITEQHYRALFDMISVQRGAPRKDDQLIHWMAHMHIDIFVHLLTHIESEEKSKEQMNEIMRYLMNGFNGLYDDK